MLGLMLRMTYMLPTAAPECVFITMQQKQKWSSILYLFDKKKIITALLLIQKLGIFFYVILIIDMWKD